MIRNGSVTVLFALVVLGLSLPDRAHGKTRNPDLEPRLGVAVSQTFLPDGASIVVTPEDRSCLVSRRIGIETSDYVDAVGQPVSFSEVHRSPATSIQAFGGSDGAIRFRVQLKYSPKPGQPVELVLADGASIDATGMIEASSDSLLISGAAAERLSAAFSAGSPVLVRAVSLDTDRRVIDNLPAPDLAALADCLGGLAKPHPRPLMPSTAIRIAFRADPETSPLATLDDLRTCGMTDQPGELHLARLIHLTGFVSHTDKVFVTFDRDGRVEQAYVPGIFDADFREGERRVRVSLAADGNVPTAENRISGCLGAQAVDLCRYRDARDVHSIAPCLEDMSVADLLGPPGIGTALPPLVLAGGPPTRFPPFLPPPGGGGGTVVTPPPDGGCLVDCDPDPPDPPAVPLPMSGGLLLAGLLGLGIFRRRRS